MQRIDSSPTEEKNDDFKLLGAGINIVETGKRKVMNGILNNIGMIVTILLIFIAIVVFTTDINFDSAFQLRNLGLSFFVILFCSYAMLINGVESGKKTGRKNEEYINACNKYEKLKEEIGSKKLSHLLPQFLKDYCDRELKNARESVLNEVGISYAEYEEKYIGKNKRELATYGLTDAKYKAVLNANKIKPIKITQDMVYKKGTTSRVRNPLGVSPSTKITWSIVLKIITSTAVSVLLSFAVFDVVANFSWGAVAECCIKVFAVVWSGFTGYRMGYNNITVDCANYIYNKIDILSQFLQNAQ